VIVLVRASRLHCNSTISHSASPTLQSIAVETASSTPFAPEGGDRLSPASFKRALLMCSVELFAALTTSCDQPPLLCSLTATPHRGFVARTVRGTGHLRLFRNAGSVRPFRVEVERPATVAGKLTRRPVIHENQFIASQRQLVTAHRPSFHCSSRELQSNVRSRLDPSGVAFVEFAEIHCHAVGNIPSI